MPGEMQRRYSRATRAVYRLALIYIICILPFVTYSVLQTTGNHKWIGVILFMIYSFQFIANTWFYVFANPSYRKFLMRKNVKNNHTMQNWSQKLNSHPKQSRILLPATSPISSEYFTPRQSFSGSSGEHCVFSYNPDSNVFYSCNYIDQL